MTNYYQQRMIKIWAILCLWSVVCITSTSAARLQPILISIEKHNTSIGDILHEMEKNSNYNILVRSNDLNLNEKASLSVKNKSIEYCLKQLLANKEVTYTIEGKNISIFRPIPQHSTTNTAQPMNDRAITGLVKDVNNEPLIGATVAVVNESISIRTDINGSFSLRVPNDAKLLISYLGYESIEVSTKGENHLTIILENSSNILEEVVAIGYGTITRKEMTSAISHISS